MNTFQITYELEDIYPDIQGELCSKHTVLLNQIQKAFRKTFPMHPPTHYVISKAIIQLAKSSNSTVTMALEQGTVIMYSAGEEGGELHISTNFSDDIVLEGCGKALNSEIETDISTSMKKIVELATQDLSLNRINGGFLYIHCQDSLENSSIKNSLLLCLFMAVLSLNDLLGEYNEEELISKLKSNEELSTCDVESYFLCNANRQLLVKRQEILKINLESKYKLLFFSLSFIDSGFFVNNEGDFNEEIIEQLSTSSDIVSFFSQLEDRLSITYPSNLLEKIKQIKQNLKIKAFILCERYVIFLAQTYRYAELIGKISKITHELHKNKVEKVDNGELMNRFRSEININSILFSSVPSRALSVLDPSSSMWF